MEIKLIAFDANQKAHVILDGTNMSLELQEYNLTQPAKTHLSKIYEDWQVNHIAKVLTEMMTKQSKPQELPPIEFTTSSKPAPLEKEIRAVCDEMANFLIEKNKAYGNSAAEPAGIFAKRINPLDQIDVRIDDKINRLMKGNEYPGDDTIVDLTGYLILRMIVAKAS